MRLHACAAILLTLSACATVPPVVPATTSAVARPLLTVGRRSADPVLGQNAAALSALFGTPVGQLSEGTARRLQFAGPACVLDAYLYPPAGGGEPAVTHVDTRRPTGEDIDRASCVAALRVGAD